MQEVFLPRHTGLKEPMHQYQAPGSPGHTRAHRLAFAASHLPSPPSMSGQLSTRESLQSCWLPYCESCWELPGWRGQDGWYLPLSNKSEFLLCLCWQCKKLFIHNSAGLQDIVTEESCPSFLLSCWDISSWPPPASL